MSLSDPTHRILIAESNSQSETNRQAEVGQRAKNNTMPLGDKRHMILEDPSVLIISYT